MHAVVVTSYDAPPAYREIDAPVARDGQILVDVLASAIHPRVRSQADGSHYTSTDELPLVPGIDGVGRTGDGTMRYFILPDTTRGAMAEQTLIDPRRSVELPDGTDPIAVAAAMNPAMSSWIALKRRFPFATGMRVLVLGATGNAGRFAIQIAKRLGASHVTAAGRDAAKLAALPALGADATIDLAAPPDAAAREIAVAGRDVDVVLDYLWGEPAAKALSLIVPARNDDDQQLTWIQIGSVAGRDAAIPSAALRATRLQIISSGQGSVSPREILAELPALAREVTNGDYAINARAVPLHATDAWAEAAKTDDRLVLVPSEAGAGPDRGATTSGGSPVG